MRAKPQGEPIDDIWKTTVSMDSLQAAWYRVSSNRGTSGGDGVHIGEFQSHLFEHLNQLRADLLSGNYRTSPFKRVQIPKKHRGFRTLMIPSLRDRILHTSMATTLTPILEPHFEDSSFAYRPNRGVTQAVARIEAWRNRGFNTVIEADIVNYFDNIQHHLLIEKLSDIICELPGAPTFSALVKLILISQADALGQPEKGLVQGSPLSPILANLYLDALDEEIEQQNVKIVRFADDFVILCKSQKKAKRVLEHCAEVLNAHGLSLHQDGTRIANFDKGFDFIGHLFVRTLSLKSTPSVRQTSKPSESEIVTTDEGIIKLGNDTSSYDPGQRVLYLADTDHSLTTRNLGFSVHAVGRGEVISLPAHRVGRVELGPSIQIDRSAIDLALNTGTQISFVSDIGNTKGFALSNLDERAGVQFDQAKAISTNEGLRLQIAAKMVGARISNQRTQLMRLARKKEDIDISHVLTHLKRSYKRLPSCSSIDELLGLEGAGTALYWSALSKLVDGQTSDQFKRSRPAKDPLNASINYLTGILERDIRAAIQASHLHIGFAFLHGTRDRHQGLVFDLMEPFRAPLTEGLPVYLFNAKRLRSEMFNEDTLGRMNISADGRQAIIKGYETAVARRVNRPDGKGKLAWRAMMIWQARTLVKAISEQQSSLFHPYLMEA